MPASGNTTSVSIQNAVALVPSINGETGPMWQCPTVALRSGNKPSEASIHIQLTDASGERNPVVSCQEFPKGTRVTVSTKSQAANSSALVFAGYIVVQQRVIEGGMVRLTALDARWLMDGVVLTGAVVYNPGGTCIYSPSTPLICNVGGQPNCCLQDGIPVFCAPNFGLGVGEYPAVGEGKAGFWSPSLLFKYFRYVATTAAFEEKMTYAGVVGLPQLNTALLNWPEALGQNIPSTEFVEQESFEGMTLTTALSKFVRTSWLFWVVCCPVSSVTR